MIEISRSLARQLRVVFKKSTRRHTHPVVTFLAEKDGLCVQTIQDNVAIEYRQAGSRKADKITVSAEALSDFEGRKNEIVTLAAVGDRAQARWFDGRVPQTREYAVPNTDKLPDFPDAPAEWSDPGPGFLKALADAYPCISRDVVRLPLDHLQFRGGSGEIHATDGRQALIQSGFSFPFKEDILVPAIAAFGCAELPRGPVVLGKTDTRMGIRVGPWTFLLSLERQRRYPDVAGVIPSARQTVTTWTVPANDGAFLAKTLPRLPGKDDDDAPVTIDLNGHAAIRVRPEGQEQITEVIVSGSKIAGPPVRFRSNRHFIERALALGIGQFQIVNADTPVVAGDDYRTYIWMLLDKARCVPPTEDALRIASESASVEKTQPGQERRKRTGKARQTDDAPAPTSVSAPAAAPKLDGFGALIEECHVLKQILREGFHRAQRLGAGLSGSASIRRHSRRR